MYMTTHCTRPQISIILFRAYCSSCKHPRQFITNLSAAASKTVRNNRQYNTLSREKCFASVSSHAASVEIYDHLVIFRALFFQLCNVMKFKKMALRLVGYLAERYFFFLWEQVDTYSRSDHGSFPYQRGEIWKKVFPDRLLTRWEIRKMKRFPNWTRLNSHKVHRTFKIVWSKPLRPVTRGGKFKMEETFPRWVSVSRARTYVGDFPG